MPARARPFYPEAMADPVLRLDSTRVSVEPGGQAQITVNITSSSSIVEGFALDVVGPEPSKWAEVIPPSVDVYPGTEASAVIVFSPPAGSAAPSGVFPFGLRARSTEDPSSSAVVEGDVTLGKVSGLQAKITPVTSAGRWRGRHTIQLSNWGNTPVQLHLVATDPDEALGFYLKPDLVDLPIGSNATVRMTVRTRKPFLRGMQTRLPFQVVGEPADAPDGPRPATPYGDPSRPVVDGALNQKPILSRTFVTVVALGLVAAIAGGVYAFTRDEPAVTSLEQLGTPEQPKDFVVVATGAETIQASWTPMAQLTGYELHDMDPVTHARRGNVKIDGSLGQTNIPGLLPNTTYCYQLAAVRETKVGPVSEEKCATTTEVPATASPSPSGPSASGSPAVSPPTSGGPASSPPGSGPSTEPPPGGGPVVPPGGGPVNPPGGGPGSPGPANSPGVDPLGNGSWVVVAGAVPGAITDPPPTATAEKLRGQNITNVFVIHTSRYDKLQLIKGRPIATPSWLTVVGPYPSAPAAEQARAQVAGTTKEVTWVVQPQPS